MDVDFIIAGQGIAGTWLSFVLWQNGYRVCVADESSGKASSLAAGALINPVNVNRGILVKDAMQLMAKTKQEYQEMEQVLSASFFKESSIIVWNGLNLKDDPEKNAFIKILTQEEQSSLSQKFSTGPATFKVEPVACVNAEVLLHSWRRFLQIKQAFVPAKVHPNQIREIQGGVVWNNISAKALIFCNGADALRQTLFQHIPFTPNYGDVLLIDIPDLKSDQIWHFGHIRLIPLGESKYWCGSNYRWEIEDVQPDADWRSETEALLKTYLRVPFIVRDHFVAERPTIAGQQPVFGFLKNHPQIGIFNGFGTRGFSLTPLLARNFVLDIKDGNIPML